MLMPSIFGETFVDDFFGYPVKRYGYRENNSLMKTDIKETDNEFMLEISLPGFKKEEIQAELKDGYLTINAATETSKEETTEKNGKYICKERYTGSCSRSFYVGDVVTKDDINAKYDNGILTVVIPKLEAKPQEEEQYFVTIQ